MRSPRKELLRMRDALFNRELTIARMLRLVFVWSPEMNRDDANSFRKEMNTFHSCSHSSIGVVSKQLLNTSSGTIELTAFSRQQRMIWLMSFGKAVVPMSTFFSFASLWMRFPTVWNANDTV